MPIPRLMTVTFQHLDSLKTISVSFRIGDSAMRVHPADIASEMLAREGHNMDEYVYLRQEITFPD